MRRVPIAPIVDPAARSCTRISRRSSVDAVQVVILSSAEPIVQAVDLDTGRTRIVARLPVPLGHAMATTVGSRILLVGGRVTANRQTDAMWWFDPATAGFTRAGRLPAPLSDAAVAAHGHRIWLLGGEDPAVTDGVLTISVR